MLVLTALLVLGLVELVMPRRLVDFWMRLATNEGPDLEVRPWVYTAARVEGLLVTLWALRRGGKQAS